jgi:2-polyprenyl-6-methoxyphenol hydroxylase-like FAD-dependent oxidoreductase
METLPLPSLRHRAIAIGGSIAGLLAARILSDYFEQVIVLDRDRLPTTSSPRRGVPQSVQPHVLFTQGYRILEDLFPGIGKDLRAAGAVPIDWGKEFHYFNQGHWNATTDDASELLSFTCTRPLLEGVIRQHVQRLPNVELREYCRVVGLVGDTYSTKAAQRATRHISGVCLASKQNSQSQTLSAQLTVDASGRSTQAPAWLKALGITPPPVTRIDAGLGYATRRYRIPANRQTPWKVLLVSQEPPTKTRLGYLAQVENNEWIATLGGYEHDYPPLDNQGFLNFAQTLADPAFYQTIHSAEPVSDVLAHRATANRLHHYEQIEMPMGFIALGDAVCALCPVYGQGMTVSALSAQVLERWLQSSKKDNRPLNCSQFQTLLAHSNAFPWSVAIGQDSQFPSAHAHAPASNPVSRLFQAYLAQLLRLAHHDADVHVRFMAMAHMVTSPLSLFSPPLIWKSMKKGL